MLQIGEPAPDFELPNQDGKPIKLSDYRGQRVVLFAFTKAGTPGCTAQACALRDEFDDLRAADAVVLTISADSQEVLAHFKRNRDLPYELLSDPDHTVLKAWGAYGMPMLGLLKLPMTAHSLWVIDENGILIDQKLGISSKAASQAIHVLAALPPLQSPS
ncbi:MAG: peroxiredoxin [Anaerolineae bacterium]|nr:peroxiredoxin [Anaerolineae bacterium]